MRHRALALDAHEAEDYCLGLDFDRIILPLLDSPLEPLSEHALATGSTSIASSTPLGGGNRGGTARRRSCRGLGDGQGIRRWKR